MGVFVVCPNSASHPEDIRRYIKEFRLNQDRIHGTSPVQFPQKLTFERAECACLEDGFASNLYSATSMPTADSLAAIAASSTVAVNSSISSIYTEAAPEPSCALDMSSDEFPFEFQTPGLPSTSPIFSPDPTDPSILPLVPTFSIVDPWIGLDNVLADDLLKVLFRTALGPGNPLRPISDDEVVFAPFCGHPAWVVRPTLVEQIYDALERLADAILCMLNRHHRYYGGSGDNVPICAPLAALDELRESILPGICLFRSHNLRRVDDTPTFPSKQQAKDWISASQRMWTYYMHWFTCKSITSIEHGIASQCNPGAAIDMFDIEFHHRVNKGRSLGCHQSIRRLMSHAVYANSMDFFCARFLSNSTKRLLASERKGQVYLTVWPALSYSVNPSQIEPGEQFLRMYLQEQDFSLKDLDAEIWALDEANHLATLYEVRNF
ncbi:hypothetical protein C8R43DRAFT_1151729 [Mycena crocata]|nr:hypothetical protein C8R43DRAFT_1151729 [Mycena crocata]